MKKLILLLFIPLISFSSFGQTIKDNDEFISLNLTMIEAQFPYLVQALHTEDMEENFGTYFPENENGWLIDDKKPDGGHILIMTYCKSSSDYEDNIRKCIWAEYTVDGYDSFNEPIIGRLNYVSFPSKSMEIHKLNNIEYIEFID